MTKRMATMLLATGAAVALASCSSGAKGGGPVTLPSISAATPTSSATTATPGGSSPTSAPTTPAGSAGPTASPSPSPSSSASSSPSSSASSSPSALAGGACASSQLTVSLGESQGAAGSQIVPLVFTNVGPTSCTLRGFPGVSFVTGSSGTQVGTAATRSGAAAGSVSLVPKETAQALLKIANTDNYPTASCSPVTVLGLRVYPPGQTAALFVALPAGSTACSASGVSQLSVQSVTAGS